LWEKIAEMTPPHLKGQFDRSPLKGGHDSDENGVPFLARTPSSPLNQSGQSEQGDVPLGKFLVLEGGEGVGKSTQIQAIAHFLHTNGIAHILTREPGGTPLAEQLRAAIVGEELDLDPIEEMLMILAARRHHVRTVIQPALSGGMWVLCDRFIDSSLVYQGIVGGLDIDLIEQWHQSIGCILVPDKTFILQVDPLVALERRRADYLACNKFDQKGINFHNKIHQAYIKIAERHPERAVLIAAEGGVEDVLAIVLGHVTSMMGL
jgi:dTMP kinase